MVTYTILYMLWILIIVYPADALMCEQYFSVVAD